MKLPIFQQTLGIAIILLLGLLGGKLAQRFKAPMVVGFIIAGLLMSPSLLNIIPEQLNEELEIFKIFGLGMIAITIGGELEFNKLKHIIGSIAAITILQVIGTSIVVFSIMYFIFGLSLPVALILGAIATASAPASPMANVREYQAQGPFTSTLLGVVAFLDAACLIFFSIVMAISGIFIQGDTLEISSLITPLIEIFGSLILGALSGLIILILQRFLNGKMQVLVLLIGFVLLNSSIAQLLHLSPILTNMTSGVLIANMHDQPAKLLHIFDDIDLPIYIAFFLLAGASLRMDILIENWLITAAYIVARGIGKVGGTFLGAKLAKANLNVQKYLGFGMFSKAGLTIGLLIIVQKTFPEVAPVITAVELAAVAVCSVIGPLGERFALIASGETKFGARRKEAADQNS